MIAILGLFIVRCLCDQSYVNHKWAHTRHARRYRYIRKLGEHTPNRLWGLTTSYSSLLGSHSLYRLWGAKQRYRKA